MKNISTLTNLQQKEIDEVLERFGFNEKDKNTYLTLLGSGPVTATPLSRALNMPATTVQSVLARLNRLGVVNITKKKTRQVYEALEPTVFKHLLEEKIKEVSDIIPLLQAFKKESPLKTKIKIYYRERATDIFNEALKAKNKLVYEIVSARELQEILGEKFHFTKRRLAAGVRLNSLRVEANEIKKYSKQTHLRELRETKFLPRELTFKANIMFWDNTVSFFSTKEEGIAWTVESATIKEMIKQIFELLWSVSRKMETDPGLTPHMETLR